MVVTPLLITSMGKYRIFIYNLMAHSYKYYLRKAHRYLGIFLGIQFLAWTIGGLYFSWTDIDEIHGDPYLALDTPPPTHILDTITFPMLERVQSLELRRVLGESYFWVNNEMLIHAQTGEVKPPITEVEAIQIANAHLKESHPILETTLLEGVGPHHEVRGRDFPLWAISYAHPDKLIAYVSAKDGSFQRIRHTSWRWFDWLWMLHTMDYQGRDDFNNLLLRIFSLMGLITVTSGFVLYGISSPTIRKWRRKLST